jgi:hypothetical protein
MEVGDRQRLCVPRLPLTLSSETPILPRHARCRKPSCLTRDGRINPEFSKTHFSPLAIILALSRFFAVYSVHYPKSYMAMSELANQLALELRSLMATPVQSKADFPLWFEKVNLIRDGLTTRYKPIAPFITEELEHYFSDPDVRLKDVDYDKRQTQIILSLISDLECGKIDEIEAKVKHLGYSISIWHSGILRAPGAVCLCFASLELAAFLCGYGSWAHLVTFPATIIFILAALGAACIYGNKIQFSIDFKTSMIIAVFCILVSFVSYQGGWYARLLCRLPLLNSAGRIVTALDKYKSDHGTYPTDSQYIASLSLPKNIQVYTGTFSNGEVNWSVFELGDSDIAVLVEPKEYGVYVPIERTSPISFSSFAAYRYFSSDRQWRLGRIHWYISGASWTND